MAYIEKEKIAEIRKEIKKTFPNFKFSITRENYSAVSIKILEGDIDFSAEWKKGEEFISERDIQIKERYKKGKGCPISSGNEFSNKAKRFLSKLEKIAKSQGWYDNSDSMTDYFDTAYYVFIKLGSWDKPYKLKEESKAA